MTGKEFEARTRSQPGKNGGPGVIILDLSGEINAFAENKLNEIFAEVESRNPETIVLNFTDVSYINSTGIALIVGMLAKARKNHQRMVVYGLSDHYLEIFQITRLADFMDIYPDESSALTGNKQIQES
jgi:anti-anti-sigma factor